MVDYEKIKKNMNRCEEDLAEYASFSKDAIRDFDESDKDFRNEYERDVDKIIYSLSFTRYIDKTQVYSLRYNDNISRRMTHVQYVSRISRTIARALKLNEDLCEAIALGHDIGHVPYGHEGEYILNDISKEKLGRCFAHNLQSVRDLYVVENNGKGINLSLQTLDGIMAHNGEILQDEYRPIFDKTKQGFLLEYEMCFADDSNIKKIRPMTLEGCVVRISDIISYIGRDIEDAIRLGFLKYEDIPSDILEVLGTNNSEIINTVINDVVENSYGKDYIKMSQEVYDAMIKLKKFNSENIYKKSMTDEDRCVLREKFKFLYDTYIEAINNKYLDNSIYKDFLNYMDEKYLRNTQNGIKVIDFIAGMTDNYFEREYKKYSK